MKTALLIILASYISSLGFAVLIAVLVFRKKNKK